MSKSGFLCFLVKNGTFGKKVLKKPEKGNNFFHDDTLGCKSISLKNEIFGLLKVSRKMSGKLTYIEKCYFWPRRPKIMFGLVARSKIKMPIWTFFPCSFWKIMFRGFWTVFVSGEEIAWKVLACPIGPYFHGSLGCMQFFRILKNEIFVKMAIFCKAVFSVFRQNHDFWKSKNSCTKMSFFCKNFCTAFPELKNIDLSMPSHGTWSENEY